MQSRGIRLSFSPKTSFILGVVVTFIFGLFVIWAVSSLKDASQNEAVNVFKDQKIEDIIKEIGSIVSLPEEIPQVMTVKDVTKLSGQAFFVDAQNGDMVLAFPKAQKAALYRPENKKVIGYSSINIPQQPQDEPVQASDSAKNDMKLKVSPTPVKKQELTRVVILNGTKEKGLAKKASDLLDKKNVEVLSLGNTVEDYKNSTIVSVSKAKKITNSDLQKIVSYITKVQVKIATISEKEKVANEADVVIILGDDFAAQY